MFIAKLTLALLLVLPGVSFAAGSGGDFPAARVNVDWPQFIARQDMSSTNLPQNWSAAPMCGNAMIGSMLFQTNNALELQLFRADVRDHRDNTFGWTAYSRPRFEIGSLQLDPVGKIQGGDWHLDLWNAEVTGRIVTDRGEIRFRHFVHAEQMVMVTELWCSGSETNCHWSWHPAPAETTRPGYPRTPAEIAGFAKLYGEHYRQTLHLYEPHPDGQHQQINGVEVWQQDLLAGGQYTTAWAETRDGNHRVLYTSLANSYSHATATATAVSAVQAAQRLPLEQLTLTHRAWWHEYYPRSFVSVPDARLEALYWQTIYRYGCTARTGRAFVSTSGLWFQGGPWPYVTTDWNLEAAHWALPEANRLEQSGELVAALYRNRTNLIQNVRPVAWQTNSACFSVAVAPDMIGSRDQDMRYWNLVGDLPWTLHNAWWQYRYSMDDAMLREKIFPLLRRSINLYLHLLQEVDGKWQLPPTYSPESGTFTNCNFDLALLKWGCQTLLWSCDRLHLADPLIPKWRAVLAHTPDFPVDKNGFMLGSNRTAPANYRHGSHLLMIYPLYLVNIDQPGARSVLNASVEHFCATTGLPAMVMSHGVPLAAAIGRSDLALAGLRKQAADLFPNGLWFGRPCIEASLAFANGLQTMLLQSWGDTIRVFPAVPDEWRDVTFIDLRTEGAFLVSAARRDGQTRFIRIKSLAGEPCRLKTDLTKPVRIGGAKAAVHSLGNSVFEIQLKRGEEIILATEGEKPAGT